MKKIVLALSLVAAGGALGAGSATWAWKPHPLNAEYVIYGGGLGDPYAPKPGDTRLAVYVSGKPAKEMFDAMGPDLKGVCGTEDGGRVRQRSEISCFYRARDGYSCDYGFDLTSGRSIGGSSC